MTSMISMTSRCQVKARRRGFRGCVRLLGLLVRLLGSGIRREYKVETQTRVPLGAYR